MRSYRLFIDTPEYQFVSLHLLHLRLVTGLFYDFASHFSQPRALTLMVMQVRPASITWRLKQISHGPDNPLLINPWAIAYLRLITPKNLWRFSF